MKREFIILMLLTLLWAEGRGQNSISGKVSIKGAETPLPGAIIYLPDIRQGTITNQEGNYQINNLPSGTFLVEIKSIGYKGEIKNLTIAGKTIFNTSLEEAAVEMNEVIVTGSVTSTQKLLNPVPLASVNQHDLQRNSQVNIIDGLTRIPGISQISTGTAISKPVIRGLGYNRVLVLHDDIRQEGQQWGDEHGVEIDENSIDKVEIVKGPGSLIYGSDAMAGVINFISTPSLPEGTIEGNFQANYQSNNRQTDYSLNTGGNLNGVNWLVRGTYKRAGNFRNKTDGIIYNSGNEEKNLNGYLGLTKKWGYSFLRFSTFNQEVGIIEGERDSTGRFLMLGPDGNLQPVGKNHLKSYSLDIPKQLIHHNKIHLSTKILLGNGSIQSDVALQQNRRKEFADPNEPENAELNFLLNSLTYDIRYNFPNLSGWRNVTGISGMYQTNSNFGEELLIPDYSLNDFGAFFTSQRTWEKFHFSAGLRVDNRFLNSHAMLTESVDTILNKFEAFKRDFGNVSFGIGVSRNLSSSVVLKLNYSKGFRAPNIAELGTNGKHEGTFRYEMGNSKLKSENSNQLDAGISIGTHHVSLEVSTFFNNVRNYIYLRKLVSTSGGDSIPDLAEPAPAYKYQQGTANLYGGEISFDIHPHPFDYIHIQQSFSVVKGILKNQSDSNRNLPFIPSPQYRAEVSVKPLKLKRLQSPYVLIEYQYFFKQQDIFYAYGTETPTQAYGVLNAGIGSDVLSKSKSRLFSIHLQATNILNERYQNHLSRLKYAPLNPATGKRGIHNPGRSFTVKVEIPLHFRG